MKKQFFLILIIIIKTSFLAAQTEKNIDHQGLIWIRYVNQLSLNDKLSIQTELDNRIFINPIEQSQFVFRTQGRYKINGQVEFGSGFAYFNVATRDPNVEPGFNVPEYRGQQDVTLKQKFGKINLNHRYQIEERFIHNYDKLGLQDGTTFFLRYRYRIQADADVWKTKEQYLKAIVYDEIMINGGNKIVKNTFDQNRVYVALQYGFSASLALELGYLNSFQQRTNGVDYFDRNIIRFSVFHKLKL